MEQTLETVNIKFLGPRTGVDFSKHELKVAETEGLLIHYLKQPNTITNAVKFINTNGIMAVTGDFGNWIFCREFHPSADGYVSDGYWCEKIRIASEQKTHRYDSLKTEKRIKEELEALESSGYEGKELEECKEYLEECLEQVDYEHGYVSYAYQNYPSFWDSECVVFEESIIPWLKVVFDAFEQICLRIKEASPLSTTINS